MTIDQEILQHNERFVADEEYLQYHTTKYPDKNLAIISCMDTRLTALLPAALGLKNGDAKIIKNAGGVLSHPFGSVMRSILVAVYDLGVTTIFVVGHYDCGMQGLSAETMIGKMKSRGVSQRDLDAISYCGIDFKRWLTGFEDPIESVTETVKLITDHPLMPKDVAIKGFLMDPATGKLYPQETAPKQL